jgi:hypothetical protein
MGCSGDEPDHPYPLRTRSVARQALLSRRLHRQSVVVVTSRAAHALARPPCSQSPGCERLDGPGQTTAADDAQVR